MNYKNNYTIPDKELIGVITCRPLYITHLNHYFSVYYVDYLCIHKHHRKKGIAPQLIQTLGYQHSKETRKHHIYLFKKETNITGIVPLTIYKTYGILLEEKESSYAIF